MQGSKALHQPLTIVLENLDLGTRGTSSGNNGGVVERVTDDEASLKPRNSKQQAPSCPCLKQESNKTTGICTPRLLP